MSPSQSRYSDKLRGNCKKIVKLITGCTANFVGKILMVVFYSNASGKQGIDPYKIFFCKIYGSQFLSQKSRSLQILKNYLVGCIHSDASR